MKPELGIANKKELRMKQQSRLGFDHWWLLQITIIFNQRPTNLSCLRQTLFSWQLLWRNSKNNTKAMPGWFGAFWIFKSIKTYTSFFKVTFWFPKWRSLKPRKSLMGPNEVTLKKLVNKYITNDQILLAYLDSVFLHDLVIHHLGKLEDCTKVDFPQMNSWISNHCSSTSTVKNCLA